MRRAFIIEFEADFDSDGTTADDVAHWFDMVADKLPLTTGAIADLHGDDGCRVFEVVL